MHRAALAWLGTPPSAYQSPARIRAWQYQLPTAGKGPCIFGSLPQWGQRQGLLRLVDTTETPPQCGGRCMLRRET